MNPETETASPSSGSKGGDNSSKTITSVSDTIKKSCTSNGVEDAAKDFV